MRNIKTLYFDEAGFTGYNLLDENQRFFCIASTDLSESLADHILCKSFDRYKSPEFSFFNLWKSSRQKKNFIKFSRELSLITENFFVYQLDKRLIVFQKIVDFLVEPLLREIGYDFYKDGYCRKFTNGFYNLFLPHPELLNGLLRCYQKFSRSPTSVNLNTLRFTLNLMVGSTSGAVGTFLKMVQRGALLFERFHVLEEFKGSDEIHVTGMLSSIIHWRQKCDDDFKILHDDSANFFRYRGLWEAITGSHVPEHYQPLSDQGEILFPLRVVSTEPVNSKLSRSIQLCDVLGGVANRFANFQFNPDDQGLLLEMAEAGLGNLPMGGVMVELEMADGPPSFRAGPDAVDLMSRVIFRTNGSEAS